MTTLTKTDVDELLRAYVVLHGGLRPAAKKAGVSYGGLVKVYRGERAVAGKLAQALGVVENERTWRRF